MLKHDFSDFRAELDRLAALYGREKPNDALCEQYWNALRDVSLDAVKACAALHVKRSKFYPKPSELRPKSSVPSEPRSPDGIADAAAARAQRRWEERLSGGGPEVRWQLLCAYLARTDLEDPSGVVFEERMRFCRRVAERLLEEFGPGWCVASPECMHVASRLLGGDAISRTLREFNTAEVA